jgi:hypothetical protein
LYGLSKIGLVANFRKLKGFFVKLPEHAGDGTRPVFRVKRGGERAEGWILTIPIN